MVAHHMSAIAIQAEAVRIRPTATRCCRPTCGRCRWRR
ncbi:hypothetical protein ACSDR0_49060 [Streptosporangium sp. G11]